MEVWWSNVIQTLMFDTSLQAVMDTPLQLLDIRLLNVCIIMQSSHTAMCALFLVATLFCSASTTGATQLDCCMSASEQTSFTSNAMHSKLTACYPCSTFGSAYPQHLCFGIKLSTRIAWATPCIQTHKHTATHISRHCHLINAPPSKQTCHPKHQYQYINRLTWRCHHACKIGKALPVATPRQQKEEKVLLTQHCKLILLRLALLQTTS